MQASALSADNVSSRDPDAPSSRRNPLACEACYNKKIKCEVDGSSAACVQCIRRNVACKFTSRKQKRESLKQTHYVRTLEDRLRKTENLLRAAGLFDESINNDGLDDYYESDQLEDESEMDQELDFPTQSSSPRDTMMKQEGSDHNVSNIPSERRRSRGDRNAMESLPPLFKIDKREDQRYYGRASSLSILSRDGIEWIKNKTGEVKFLGLLFSNPGRDSPWDYWRPDVFHDVFSSQVFKPLPPRAEVFALIRDYFRTVNRLFPLYHKETFMRLIEWQYTQQTCDDAARWASINIIISLAYEYRFSNSQKSEKDREKAWLYYKNAMSVFAELTLRRTDMLSVQALLGMALFLRGNSGTQSSLPIVTAAIRACHRMGFHRNLPRPHLSHVQQEQTKRVFWIAYILDQSTCIRAGNAPAQHHDDFDVEFPAEEEDDFALGNNISFFSQLCRMTEIKGRIYSRLYSTKAMENKSAVEVLEIVRELHEELIEWRKASPFDYQLKQKRAGEDFLVGFACAGLQFVYYNSMIMVHRVPLVMHLSYVQRLATGGQVHYDPKVILNESSASTAVCVQAARDTLRLVNNLPWGDIAWIWSLLYYVFLAVMTIFVNILRDSRHPNAKEDLQSLNMASTFFTTLIPGDGPCNYARFMSRMCANFERIARSVVEREQKTIRPNERHPSREPVKASTSSNPSTAHTSLYDRPTQTSSSSSTNYSTDTPVNIPDLEGLPPINSSGYVVPGSPGPPSPPTSSTTIAPPNTDTDTNMDSCQTIPPPTASIPPAPSQQQQQSLFPPDFFFPESVFPLGMADSFPQPDLWQIPLAADWDFGSPFVTGPLGPTYPTYDGGNGGVSGPSSASTTLPMEMGYGLGSGSAGGSGSQEINPNTNIQQGGGGGGSGQTVWTDRCYLNFY